MPTDFEIVGEITHTETIASGASIHRIRQLRRMYGRGRGRKMKGRAWVRPPDATIRRAEVHWYETHGIGRKGMKIKRLI